MRKQQLRTLVPSLGLSILALGLSDATEALTFQNGEFRAQLDSSLSIGAIWSVDSPDKALIGAGNGGDGVTMVGDDGRLNFRSGDMVSNVFKGVHDLNLTWKNSGLFVRGNYWYDFELKDGNRELYDISDDGRLTAAKSAGAQVLDAYIYHDYLFSGMSGSARLGKQVVATALPGAVRITEVNRHTRFLRNFSVTGHFTALVVGHAFTYRKGKRSF